MMVLNVSKIGEATKIMLPIANDASPHCAPAPSTFGGAAGLIEATSISTAWSSDSADRINCADYNALLTLARWQVVCKAVVLRARSQAGADSVRWGRVSSPVPAASLLNYRAISR